MIFRILKLNPNVFYLIFLFLVFFDQAVKYTVVSKMSLGHSITLIAGFFSLTYITNTGAAFGMLKGANSFFIILSAGFIVFMYVYLLSRKSANIFTQTAFAFIAGGAFGNLLDRIFRGHVVDFFDLRYFSVFNTADVMINLGVALLVIEILFGGKSKERA